MSRAEVICGRLLCVPALLLASPYASLVAGGLEPMQRTALALLLGGAGLALWHHGGRASAAPDGEGAAPTATNREILVRLSRYAIAATLCIGTWIVPALLVEAANGNDRSDQAIGNAFVTLLVSLVIGPVLAALFLRATRPPPSP